MLLEVACCISKLQYKLSSSSVWPNFVLMSKQVCCVKGQLATASSTFDQLHLSCVQVCRGNTLNVAVIYRVCRKELAWSISCCKHVACHDVLACLMIDVIVSHFLCNDCAGVQEVCWWNHRGPSALPARQTYMIIAALTLHIQGHIWASSDINLHASWQHRDEAGLSNAVSTPMQ